MRATRIKIADQLPLLTDRDRLILDFWTENGSFNVSLYERIKKLKQAKK